MKTRIVLSCLFLIFGCTSGYTQQQPFYKIKNLIYSQAAWKTKYDSLHAWIIARFLSSEKLGLLSLDSVFNYLPHDFALGSSRNVLDDLEYGISPATRTIILDSCYHYALRTNDIVWQGNLFTQYFKGDKLGSYLKELDSGYALFEKADDRNNMASNDLFHGNFYYDRGYLDKAISFYKKALNFYLKDLNKRHVSAADTYLDIGDVYLRKGMLDSSLYYDKIANQTFNFKDYYSYKTSFLDIANIYRMTGEYDSAFIYVHKAEALMHNAAAEPLLQSDIYTAYINLYTAVYEYDKAYEIGQTYLHTTEFNKDTLHTINAFTVLSFIKYSMSEYDSALQYSTKNLLLLKDFGTNVFKSDLFVQHANNLLALNSPDSALYYVRAAYLTDSASGSALNMTRDIYLKGNIFLKLHDTVAAFENYFRAKKLLQPVTDIVLASNIYKALSETEYALHHLPDAWMHLNNYIKLKDSINRFQNIYALYDLDVRYKLSEQKNKADKLALTIQKNRLWIISSLVFSIFIVFVFIFLRINYKNKMQFSIQELQQRAMRAQLNPHFIFNVMQSIKNEYAVNAEKGEELLVSFSALIREILNKSFLFEGTLEEEIELIKKYLNVQSQQASSFHFLIKVDDTINTYQTVFPSLALQPIIENAIKYGGESNHINLSIKKSGKLLVITIENDSVKDISEASNQPYTSNSGTGLRLTKERVHLFNKKYKVHGGISFMKNNNKFIAVISLAHVTKYNPRAV